MNILNPGTNIGLEEQLEKLPDLIADAYIKWQSFKEERERQEAVFCLKMKATNQQLTATELKWEARSDGVLYKMRLEEILLEGEHLRLLETHLANKKRADMRTAF